MSVSDVGMTRLPLLTRRLWSGRTTLHRSVSRESAVKSSERPSKHCMAAALTVIWTLAVASAPPGSLTVTVAVKVPASV